MTNISDLCAIASSKHPKDWPLEVIEFGIFGFNQVNLAIDKFPLKLIDALTWTLLSSSNSQARNSIQSGAVRINNIICKDVGRILIEEDILQNISSIVLENGRLNYGIVEVIPSNLNQK